MAITRVPKTLNINFKATEPYCRSLIPLNDRLLYNKTLPVGRSAFRYRLSLHLAGSSGLIDRYCSDTPLFGTAGNSRAWYHRDAPRYPTTPPGWRRKGYAAAVLHVVKWFQCSTVTSAEAGISGRLWRSDEMFVPRSGGR